MFSTIRDVLSSSLLFWEIAGFISTVVVILGCVGEYIAEFTRIPKTDDGKHRISRLSLIILTVGIAGELLTAVQSSLISGHVIADLQATATAAKKSASDAADAATRAKTSADGAETKAEAVGNEADAVGLKVAAVSKMADQIDAGLRATQYAFSMRNLQSLASRDQLIEQLKRFKGKTVFVRSYRYMGDADGFRVCKMVIDLAHSAGMNPVDQCSTLLPGETPTTGIQVCGPNDQEMLSLSKALTPIDVGSTCPWGKVPHSPDLLISVGSKALMGIGETFQTEDAAKRAATMKKHPNP
jgi:hypothetical protein